MPPRPPGDAIVALRSLGRRFRGVFAGLGDDESPDDLGHRVGPDGWSAVDHVVAATRTLELLDRALAQVLSQDDVVLPPAVLDTSQRTAPPGSAGTVDDALAELSAAAERLAERADRVRAQDWSREARVADHDARVTASAILWDAVDSAVEHLRAAERTLAAVRGR